MRALRARKLSAIGIQNGTPEQGVVAFAAGLITLQGGRDVQLERGGRPIPAAPPVVEPAAATLLVTEPVRSGQRIFADRGELIVVASVGSGAELIAHGSIHIYGPLRGRALAGVNGDKTARIFCQSLEAELVAIAGLYRTSDDLGPECPEAARAGVPPRRDAVRRAPQVAQPSGEEYRLAKIIVVTSGKGGVGKTTSTAAIGAGLAMRGHKTVVIDFDVGLRNLDMIMGCERRVVFDFINVIQGDAKLRQALITDRRLETLSILPTSQTRDKDALTREGVEKVLDELREQFDYIICDSPAGIERGAHLAMYFADEAVVVTNPEVSSVRDSDRVLGLLSSKTHRAEKGGETVKSHLLLTRYDAQRVARGEMMNVEDILEILSIPLLGIVPESTAVLRASNVGTPVVFDEKSNAGKAYGDAVSRLIGEQIEMEIQPIERPGLFQRLLRRTA